MSLPLAHTLLPQDVTVHLRSAPARLVSVAQKEALIREGVSYGLLLTPERPPSEAQQQAYLGALSRNGSLVAQLVVSLCAELLAHYPQPVLVSLARAGTPVGCAMRRLARRWGHDLPHHSLSIIRGVGIDQVALTEIRAQHPQSQLIFVDGWTGKGSILDTLRASLPPDIAPILAVLSDPAGVATHAATHHDLLLPHAALNATVCGLLSRTYFTHEAQMHAARIEEDLRPLDQTLSYLKALDTLSVGLSPTVLDPGPRPVRPFDTVLSMAAQLGVTDPHLVKPSVGEATRVFLRREPAQLLLQQGTHPDTLHLLAMAQQSGVPIHLDPQLPYLAAALIAPKGPAA